MNKIYYEITKMLENLPIAIYHHYKTPYQLVKAHWHRSLELTLNLEGKVDFYNGSHHKTICENQVSITNSEEIHYSIPHYDCFENKIVGITLQINYSFLKRIIPDFDHIYFIINQPDIEAKIALCIKNISNLSNSSNDDRYIKMYQQLLEIIDLLYHNCTTEKTNYEPKKMKEVLHYIHQHYHQNILLYQVANYFGYNREYFARLFKQEVGLSFKQYLTRYRLYQSSLLLKETDKSILDIAYELGFSSENQFILNFKKYYGITPGKFRKSLFK